MECNRDEATRAKEIAEKKFAARDIAGAKRFAQKAQSLYPGLEGLPQMLITLDVHLSAETKVGGEADWYGILGVDPRADDEFIKSQYRKLALMLHPDKNKSVGADGAFKMISEAWSFLSDKMKKISYDQKRFPKASQLKVPPASRSSSVPPTANGFHNGSNINSNSKAHKTSGNVGTATSGKVPGKSNYGKVGTATSGNNGTTPGKVGNAASGKVGTSPAPSHHFMPTFWTVCTLCKMQYEYLRVYLNHKLRCPSCEKPFFAVETAAPSLNSSKSYTPLTSYQQNQNLSHKTASNSAHASAAMYDKVKREHEFIWKKQPVSKMTRGSSSGYKSDPKGERVAKKRKMTVDGGDNASKEMASGIGGIGVAASGTQQSGFEKHLPNFVPVPNKLNGTRDLSLFELRNMLMEKAKKEILKKLNEWKLAAAGNVEGKPAEEAAREKQKLKKPSAVNSDTSDRNKEVESADAKRKFQEDASLKTSGVDSDTEAPMSIIVPDSDFHDFDKDRCERSFKKNEVWAAYDDDDGMPRYYAMIHQVISLKPFKVKISWLNSKTNNELGPLNWISSGFYKTCGDFRIGKYEVNKSLNSFSHRVRGWAKGTRGVIQIFPCKGDVWALYHNWSPDWDENTPDEVIHKYDMVEVLEDYKEELGVSVTPLVKVTGFKAVFHRHLDPSEVRIIPREEMFRLSHQVPYYLLTGSEAQNVPVGSIELDPAATSLELLQVATENKLENGTGDDEVMTEAMEK